MPSQPPTRSSSLDQQLRSDPQPSNGVGPCPIALKSILRRKLCYNRASASTDSVNSTCSHRSVKFDEHVNEHLADEWDRSSCAVACPTSRDIWELKQMQRELLPTGCGVIQDDRGQAVAEAEEEYFFDLYGDDDVDCSQRRPPPRQPKKLLNKVPIGLCPILPAAAPVISPTPLTPNNSKAPSPLDSPPHGSPVLAPVKDREDARNKRGGPMMKFMPLLPPTPPEQLATTSAIGKAASGSDNIPTPPETPTFAESQLPTVHDVRSRSPPFLPCGPAPVQVEQGNDRASGTVTSSELKDVPRIQLSSSPSRSPPTLSRLTLLPVLPQRASTSPRSSPGPSSSIGMSSSSTWPSGSRTSPSPAMMMKTGGRPLSTGSTTTTTTTTATAAAAGFMPFTMSFKATGRT